MVSLRLGPRSTPEGSDSFVAPGKRPQVGGVYWHRASGHSASACICVRVQMRVRTSGKGVQSPAGVMVVVSAALDQGGQRLQSKNFPVRKTCAATSVALGLALSWSVGLRMV